jgi:hypothetical protein
MAFMQIQNKNIDLWVAHAAMHPSSCRARLLQSGFRKRKGKAVGTTTSMLEILDHVNGIIR